MDLAFINTLKDGREGRLNGVKKKSDNFNLKE